jgi:hypothetical protein
MMTETAPTFHSADINLSTLKKLLLAAIHKYKSLTIKTAAAYAKKLRLS